MGRGRHFGPNSRDRIRKRQKTEDATANLAKRVVKSFLVVVPVSCTARKHGAGSSRELSPSRAFVSVFRCVGGTQKLVLQFVWRPLSELHGQVPQEVLCCLDDWEEQLCTSLVDRSMYKSLRTGQSSSSQLELFLICSLPGVKRFT